MYSRSEQSINVICYIKYSILILFYPRHLNSFQKWQGACTCICDEILYCILYYLSIQDSLNFYCVNSNFQAAKTSMMNLQFRQQCSNNSIWGLNSLMSLIVDICHLRSLKQLLTFSFPLETDITKQLVYLQEHRRVNEKEITITCSRLLHKQYHAYASHK